MNANRFTSMWIITAATDLEEMNRAASGDLYRLNVNGHACHRWEASLRNTHDIELLH